MRGSAGSGVGMAGRIHTSPQFPPWVMPWLLTNPGLAAQFRLAGRSQGRCSSQSVNSLQFPTPGVLGLVKQTRENGAPNLDSQRALYLALQKTMGEEMKRAELARSMLLECSRGGGGWL